MTKQLELLKVDVYDAIHETTWNYLIDCLGEPSGEMLGSYHDIHGSLMEKVTKQIKL